METIRPAEVFSPGEFIREELEARGWTQADLAGIIDRPIQTVNLIITGKKTITARTAKELAAAFGTSSELWLNLQSAYSLSLEEEPTTEIKERAKLYQIAPVKVMEARQWIRKTRSLADLKAELSRFYGVANFDSIPKLPVAARAGAISTSEATSAQITWAYRVQQLAKNVHASSFSASRARQKLNELLRLAAYPEEIRKVPRVLAEMGIRLVIVDRLPKSKIDGASLLPGKAPIIGLSLRYDRIDYFWHTLAHELSHVFNKDVMIDVEIENTGIEDDSKAMIENRADKDACEMLIPKAKLDSFIARVGPLYSKERINRFANLMKVHPGIVVGQLQDRREIPYSHSREMLVPVRDIVIQAAITDGFGKSVCQT